MWPVNHRVPLQSCRSRSTPCVPTRRIHYLKTSTLLLSLFSRTSWFLVCLGWFHGCLPFFLSYLLICWLIHPVLPSLSKALIRLSLPGNSWLPLLIPSSRSPDADALSVSQNVHFFQFLPRFQGFDLDPPFLGVYHSQCNWHDAYTMNNEGAKDTAVYNSVPLWLGKLPCCLVFQQELGVWKTQPGWLETSSLPSI